MDSDANLTPPPFVVPPKRRDYLIPSILVTLLCCLPFGVVAIVCSVRAGSAYDFGKYDEAERHAKHAFRWMLAGAIGGALGVLAYILFVFGMFFTASLCEECDADLNYEEPVPQSETWSLPSEGEIM